MRRITRLAVPVLIGLACSTARADDAATRLRAARSLRCTFTLDIATWIRSGHRTVEQTTEKSTVDYDNINIAKGTARIVAHGDWGGAGDLTVWMERTGGSLWLLERAPSGNVITTTVFPMYAEGTAEFVALESRHWITGATVVGQQTYGTCQVLE